MARADLRQAFHPGRRLPRLASDRGLGWRHRAAAPTTCGGRLTPPVLRKEPSNGHRNQCAWDSPPHQSERRGGRGAPMNSAQPRRRNLMEQLIETLANGLGNGVGWLAEHGVLFAI